MPKRSQLELKFVLLWKEIKGQPLCEEHRFHATRKWRFDFAHLEARVAVEIEGGVWGQSRHTKPVGYIKDCEKYNAALFDGWAVVRLPNYWLNTDTLLLIKQLIIERCLKNTRNTGRAASKTKSRE